MPSSAAILKNEKQKQKTHENKNEEPDRRRKINRNYKQQNEQPTPWNQQAHDESYWSSNWFTNTVQPCIHEVTKNFQAVSLH